MPAAYPNISAYEHHLNNRFVPNISSPLTPGEQESFFTYNYDQRTMSTAGSFSPSSMESSQLMDISETPIDNIHMQVFDMNGEEINPNEISLCDGTELKIVVQPVDKFRFRYKSEMMGTHGSLLGEREDSNHKKEVPTVQLINCPLPTAVIRCTLVTADEGRRFPHAHHLVRKSNDGDTDDPHDIEVSENNDFTAMFCNMGIIHTAKKNIKDEIIRKRRFEKIEEKKRLGLLPSLTTKEEVEMKMEAENSQKWMNLNTVALCFQGFAFGANNALHPITDKIYTRPINNLKSALTGELKICRIDKSTSSCEGGEEVWLLVEKVGKKNIKVKFFEVDDRDNVIWEAEGRFSELDVHHQYAIVFRTPPYKDTNITTTKEVLMKLERPSDGEVSNSLKFFYKPTDKSLNRKRPRFLTTDSVELAQSAAVTSSQMANPASERFTVIEPETTNDMSAELKKIFTEDDEIASSDLKAYFINNKSDLETMIHDFYTGAQTVDGSRVVPDGCLEENNRATNFAANVLQDIKNIIKELESNKTTKPHTLERINELLSERTNFNDTPLHYALRNEEYEIVKSLLIVLGIDPTFKRIANLQNSGGKTPLHLAVMQNQSDIVRALLKLGVDPNVQDEDDETALHSAVKGDAIESIYELIRSSPKLNFEAHRENGWSALHLAAQTGSLQAVKVLIEAGADVNATDMSYGRTALHIAIDSNHKHIVTYLLASTKVKVNTKNFGGNTALHSAVAKGGKCAEELIKILKKFGADPNIRNNNVVTQDENDDDHNDILNPADTEPSSSTDNQPSSIGDAQSSIVSQMTALTVDSATPTIKSESSETDDEAASPGESSFDLARDNPSLMHLLRDDGRPEIPQEEELLLKEEENEDEMTLQDRSMLMQNRTITPPQTPEIQQQQAQQQRPAFLPGEERLTDMHVLNVVDILDRTGEWEKLAYNTNHGSLVRLYKKVKSPSRALFVKIRLQQPDISVRQVKKWLIDIQAFEAATALDQPC